MSLASERLVIPITAKDKARVERKAAMAGRLSTAEFVRRAALNYEPADEAAQLSCAASSRVSKSCMRTRSLSLIAPTRLSTRHLRISTGTACERYRRCIEGDQTGDPA